MSRHEVMMRVRRALGRPGPTGNAVPAPTAIDEPIVRLVHSEIGLAELFTRMARENHMTVERVSSSDLPDKMISVLRDHDCRRVGVSSGGVVEKLRLTESLRAGGIHARSWDELTLDEVYDLDAGVTDVSAAVAETGSLVVDGSPRHGRALSLVPPVHIAIVEPRNLLPDLLDLFELLSRDPTRANTVIITGPSKTADIEMNLVTGVHGPGVVAVLVLQ